MTTPIAEYSPTEAALAELRNKYENAVFPVTTTKGMTEAVVARAELRDHRVGLEKMRVEIKAPALERCRQIDTEAKRITAELVALEEPIDQQIKAEQQRKEREKAAKEEAERQAQEAIRARFDAVKALPLAAIGMSADAIRELIAKAEQIDGEFVDATMVEAFKFERSVSVAALKAALDKQLASDAEAEKIKAERAELERLRDEQEAVRAEADRLAQAERDRVAAAEREAAALERAKQDAIAAAAREAREQEEARINAERAATRAREDAERAEAARKLREEQEAAAAERVKLEADKKAAAKAAREAEIANAGLHDAAVDAVAFLKARGFADELVTQKLEAACKRERTTKKKAA